jgi:hypothetical protein
VRRFFLRVVQSSGFHKILVASYGKRKMLVAGAISGRVAGINKHHRRLEALQFFANQLYLLVDSRNRSLAVIR